MCVCDERSILFGMQHFVGGNAALMAAKIQQTQPDMQVHTHTHTCLPLITHACRN